METTLDGVTGDWGPGDWVGSDAGGFTLPNGPQVQAHDVLTQTTTAVGQDRWTSFFQNLIATTGQYALQKDAIKSGITPTPITTSNGQTTYAPTGTAAANSRMSWVIIGGAVVIGLVLVASHKG